RGSLTNPEVYKLYGNFPVDLTKDTPQTKMLAEKARQRWMEFCNRVGCADLEERQRNQQYKYEIDL
ncbi:MAG: hypothetical protein QME12_04880, partial [Nanoarchaeota archaeon]|nr:hypothetical protein [Nanoarchaeota archaeon]